jgi:hypothetical protein
MIQEKETPVDHVASLLQYFGRWNIHTQTAANCVLLETNREELRIE